MTHRRRVHALPALPPRARDAHKGSCGSVLVVGGSPGMTGAPWLASRAALSSGAGLVTTAVPATIFQEFQGRATATMTIPITLGRGGVQSAATELIEHAGGHDVVAIGCGLGRSAEMAELFERVVPEFEAALVVDADGLRLAAARGLRLAGRAGPAVLTPHPGEMATLARTTTATVQADRAGVAAAVAIEHRAVVCLKGDRTVVSDGERVYVNYTGNPGLATAGSGDVLAGMIAGLRARGLDAFDAAQLGAYLHGLAGDLAARRCGQESLDADRLLAAIPDSFLRLREV